MRRLRRSRCVDTTQSRRKNVPISPSHCIGRIRRCVKITAAKAPRPRAGEGGTRDSGRARVRADARSKETLFRRLRGPTLIRLGSRSPPSPASGRRAGRSDPVAATIFTHRLSGSGGGRGPQEAGRADAIGLTGRSSAWVAQTRRPAAGSRHLSRNAAVSEFDVSSRHRTVFPGWLRPANVQANALSKPHLRTRLGPATPAAAVRSAVRQERQTPWRRALPAGRFPCPFHRTGHARDKSFQ
jgi:hypothetical protein